MLKNGTYELGVKNLIIVCGIFLAALSPLHLSYGATRAPSDADVARIAEQVSQGMLNDSADVPDASSEIFSLHTQALELAVSSETRATIRYKTVTIGELLPAYTGLLAQAKLSIPETLVLSTAGSGFDESLGIQFKAGVESTANVRVDSRGNFEVYDYGSGWIPAETFLTRSDPSAVVKESKFQGQKKMHMLIVHDDSNGSEDSVGLIAIYEPGSDSVVTVNMKGAIEGGVWDTFLKSALKPTKFKKSTLKDTQLNKSPTSFDGFSMKLPQGWTSSQVYEKVLIESPNQLANIIVGIEPKDGIEYEPVFYSFYLEMFKRTYEEEMENFVFKGSKKTTIGGMPGFTMEYEMTTDGIRVRVYQVITIQDGYTYALSAIALKDQVYSKYKKVMQKSLATFKLE